jgi:hypothetical protein
VRKDAGGDRLNQGIALARRCVTLEANLLSPAQPSVLPLPSFTTRQAGLEVVLVQVSCVNRVRPIEHVAIAPTRKQRRVRYVLVARRVGGTERVDRSQVVPELVGQPGP